MSGDPDVWEVMRSARTIRRFTGEPVDDAALVRCIEAATWAPSGANQQAWRFVILRSPQARRTVAEAPMSIKSLDHPEAEEQRLLAHATISSRLG